MNRFEISLFGIRLAARSYAGIVGAIVVTALILGYALGIS